MRTAIFKSPVAGRVAIRRLGLEGDDQADKRVHGGLDQAVYVYDHGYYQQWQELLDRNDFEYGQFGENLTVEGLPDDEVCIGDVFSIGSAEVQVSHPRTPCFKLGLKMGDPTFVKAFH
ncbi:MAG: MOSC domain-containing protein [Planctomycetota bacterium]